MDSRIKMEEGNCAAAKDTNLFYLSWQHYNPKAIVVMVHGVGEHCGRYVHVGEFFSQAGYSVYAYDLRGHGRSTGIRGHVGSFNDYVNDLRLFLGFVRNKENKAAIYMLGHSLGALIILRYIQLNVDNIAGLILIAPPFKLSKKIPLCQVIIAHCMTKLVPKFQLIDYNIGHYYLSHDKGLNEAYKSDPYIYKERSVRFYTEFVKAKQKAMEGVGGIKIPSLFLVGGQENIVSLQSIRDFYDKMSCKNKKIIVYKGLYHEILNEPQREKVMQDIVEWVGVK